MTLISILAAIVIERFLTHLEHLRWPRWFPRYAGWLHGRLNDLGWDSRILVLLHVLWPVLAVGLLNEWLSDEMFGLVGFVFATLVLIYCLGPRDLDTQVEDYLAAAAAGDDAGARAIAAELITREPPGGEAQHRAVADAVLVQAGRRVFAVLFWFAVLGPVGAMLYRVADLLDEWSRRDQDDAEFMAASARLHGLLAWLPGRLVALGYAVTGSFEDALHAWRAYYNAGPEQDADDMWLLLYVGNGALRLPLPDETGAADDPSTEGPDRVRAALGLVWRTVIAWITVLALLTLSGWAG